MNSPSRSTYQGRGIVLGLVLGFSALSTPSTRAAGPDPFYLGQLADGTQAFDRAEWGAAARTLRIACFGLLEEPLMLTPCLARLGIAQDEVGDIEGFRDTFRRVLDAETRFAAYSRAEIPAAVRLAFEQHVAKRIPQEVLAAQPAFRGLLSQKAALAVEALPPKARREELAKRIAAEPREPIWHVLAGRLEIAENRPSLALAEAQSALALAPKDPRALCVRGLAYARLSQCALAIPDLSGCSETARFATPAAAYLECLIDQRLGADAQTFAASLPVSIRDDREVQKLARQAAEIRDDPKPEAAPRPTAVSTPKSESPAPSPTVQQRQSMTEARSLLTPEASARDLKRALKIATELADTLPSVSEVQLVAAEAAYRNSRWDQAATYFRRAGDPGESRPELLFYLAVSAFESGDRTTAANALKRALPNLQASPFIDEYTKKILGEVR